MKKKILRALASLMAILLGSLIGLNAIATEYAGAINLVLNPGSRVVNVNYDQLVYGSDFGDFTAENQQKLLDAEDAFIELETEEGAVLLKNNGALPLSEQERNVTLFGNSVADPVYCGKAGGAVLDPNRLISMDRAFEDRGFNINRTLFDAYANSGVVRVVGGKDAAVGEVGPEFYTDTLKNSFAQYNDVAIVMFSRTAGEGMDMLTNDIAGMSHVALHPEERALMEMIRDSGTFKKFVVLINSSYAIEVDWLDEFNVDACLVIGETGLTGFYGVVDLLTGAANPSGHLVDTYAADSLSSPAIANFGDQTMAGGDGVKYTVAQEGIYFGYKYYETRYEDCILQQGNADGGAGTYASDGGRWNYAKEMSYPFGYGLSYTDFEQTLDSFSYDAAADQFTIQVTVTNTGNRAGKSVVQLYFQSPYTDYDRENLVEKSAIQLGAFAKTDELQPGASQTLTLTLDRYYCASYDTNGVKGYLLDAGTYYFAIGDDAHSALNNILAAKGASGMFDIDGTPVAGDTSKVASYELAEPDADSYAYSKTGQRVTNVFFANYAVDINAFYDTDVVTYLTRQDWEGTYPVPTQLEANDKILSAMDSSKAYKKPSDSPSVADVLNPTDSGIALKDMNGVAWDDPQWDIYLDQLTLDDLARVTADMNGGQALESGRRPATLAVDGPKGISGQYPYGGNCSVYAGRVTAASSWNTDILRQLGSFIAEDCLWSNAQIYWAPGANLHRTALSGRNFEYYSEDCMLSAYYLDAETAQYELKGVICGPKHFAANDQETNRNRLLTFMTEQRMRQECLRAFEMGAVNHSYHHLMTSYNSIGCKGSNSCAPMLKTILDQEWGFDGYIITDAGGANFENASNPTLKALENGVDQLCFLDNRKSIVNYINENDDGSMVLILRDSAKDQLYWHANSNLVNGMSSNETVSTSLSWWQIALYAAIGVSAVLMAGSAAMFVYTAYISKKGRVQA